LTLEQVPIEWVQHRGATISPVIAGLDPAIHLLRTNLMRRRWTRGSSPRVTAVDGVSTEPN
jgi:hypothetical protein